MPDTNSTNLGLLLMATGGDANAWGANLNSSVFTILDNVLGSKLSKSVAGSSNTTLSSTEAQNLYFTFTGVLTGNINVIFPASAGRAIVVNNATTGSFTLTVIPSGGTGFLVTQGSTQLVMIDGTSNIALSPLNTILPFEVSLASASTTDLGATGTNVVSITGTTTITSFGNTATTTECLYFLRFTGALTLTNGANMILPTGANITTAAGDTALVKFEGSSKWRFMFYQPAAGYIGAANPAFTGTATLNANGLITKVVQQIFTATGTYTPTSGMVYCVAEVQAAGGAGGGIGSGVGAGGGAGGYSKGLLTAANIGASKAVTIGGAGSNSSIGTLIVCAAGTVGGTVGSASNAAGGVGGTVSTAGNIIAIGGQTGGDGFGGSPAWGGAGANSPLGFGGTSPAGNSVGRNATGYGAGGGGSINNATGGTAGAGIVTIIEFVSA